MPEIHQILQFEFAGNSIGEWTIALSVFLVMFIALQLFRKLLVVRLVRISKKTNSKVDDVISGFLADLKWPVFLLVALFFSLKGIKVPDSISLILDLAILIVIVSQVIHILEEVVMMLMVRQLHKSNPEAVLPVIFRLAIRIVLWSVGFLMILSNAGVNVTSLIAGLGIGGLAISLALQNILSDLFSSFSIAVDKPFAIGDYIVVDDHEGTVKSIGLKTTRLTALKGEEIVISNSELTSARVHNYKKMKKRRVVMSIGITYDTTPEKLSVVNAIIQEAVQLQDQVEFDRTHFKSFGDSALLFEIVFYMLTSEYAVYMDTQQQINLHIHKHFAQEGISMAFPTQTVYVKKTE